MSRRLSSHSRPQGVIVQQTLTRVFVAKQRTPPPDSSGCWQGGCGCLVLALLLVLALGAIGSCADAAEPSGQESIPPALQLDV